jgi:hypothetical protein
MNIDFDASFAGRDLIPTPDLTGTPPRDILSKATQALYDAREEAYSAYVEAEAEHYELLSHDWAKTYVERDEAAGSKALQDGIDPLSIPSELERATVQRPRIKGYVTGLVQRVNVADRALTAAVRTELDTLGPILEERVRSSAADYLKHQAKADAARAVWGGALVGYDWFINVSRLGLRSDYPEHVGDVEPRDATNQPAADLYGRLVAKGPAEVKHIHDSFGLTAE